eukprot:1763171-Amphidinium_carterae.2
MQGGYFSGEQVGGLSCLLQAAQKTVSNLQEGAAQLTTFREEFDDFWTPPEGTKVRSRTPPPILIRVEVSEREKTHRNRRHDSRRSNACCSKVKRGCLLLRTG